VKGNAILMTVRALAFIEKWQANQKKNKTKRCLIYEQEACGSFLAC